MTDWMIEVILCVLWIIIAMIVVVYIDECICRWWKDRPMARRRRKK